MASNLERLLAINAVRPCSSTCSVGGHPLRITPHYVGDDCDPMKLFSPAPPPAGAHAFVFGFKACSSKSRGWGLVLIMKFILPFASPLKNMNIFEYSDLSMRSQG